MKRKLSLLLAMILIVTLSLMACGKTPESQPEGDNGEENGEGVIQETRTIKLGHSGPPGSSLDVVVQNIAEEVEKRTDGALIIEIYPGAQLGDEGVMLDSLMSGTLDMDLAGTPIMANVMPEFNMLSMPFLFRNTDEFFDIVNTDDFIAKSNAITNPKGIVLLGYPNGEMRGLSNVKREVRTPADLKGLNIRVMNGPLYTDMFKALGAMTTTLSFGEVYSALQQGVIDGEDNGINMLDMMKFMEVEKFHTVLGHTIQTNPLLINKQLWDSLSEEHRNVIQEVVTEEAKAYPTKVLEPQIAASKKVVEENGVKVIMELTQDEYQAFKDAVEPVYDKYKPQIGDDFYQYVMDKISDYRK
ncbi:MAG: TRAP transporter substrate-binding protein [Firmicutes bacterium]|nr:TRAP transporter substrate-binding protein [Bacillota bacterium]